MLLQFEKKSVIAVTIIDYTKPSTDERIYVIDLETPRLAFHSLVFIYFDDADYMRSSEYLDKEISRRAVACGNRKSQQIVRLVLDERLD